MPDRSALSMFAPGSVAIAVEEAAAKFGRIDILVNNAAVSVNGPIESAADRSADYEITSSACSSDKVSPESALSFSGVSGSRLGLVSC